MKKSPLEILFLGTGTSHGIPMIGCRCAVCRSDDPRDRRDRASVVVSWNGRRAVIDTGAEFRKQVLAHEVDRVDAALYTHPHADHVHGIDDLRNFSINGDEPLPVYADERTVLFLRRSFPYIFGAHPSVPNIPRLALRTVSGAFDLFGQTVVPVPICHAEDNILGFRLGRAAYLTDCSGVPASSLPLLEGLDLLVVGALRPTPHPKHFSVGQALDLIASVSPRRALLTHISHRLAHRETEEALPPGVGLAYDGLRVQVQNAPPPPCRSATGVRMLY